MKIPNLSVSPQLSVYIQTTKWSDIKKALVFCGDLTTDSVLDTMQKTMKSNDNQPSIYSNHDNAISCILVDFTLLWTVIYENVSYRMLTVQPVPSLP